MIKIYAFIMNGTFLKYLKDFDKALSAPLDYKSGNPTSSRNAINQTPKRKDVDENIDRLISSER